MQPVYALILMKLLILLRIKKLAKIRSLAYTFQVKPISYWLA